MQDEDCSSEKRALGYVNYDFTKATQDGRKAEIHETQAYKWMISDSLFFLHNRGHNTFDQISTTISDNVFEWTFRLNPNHTLSIYRTIYHP